MSMMDLRGQCWKKNENGSRRQLSGTVWRRARTVASRAKPCATSSRRPSGYGVDRLYENEPVNVGGIPTGASGVMTPYEVTLENVCLLIQAHHGMTVTATAL